MNLHTTKGTHKALKFLAVSLDTTIQALAEQGFELVLAKHTPQEVKPHSKAK